MPGAFEGFGRGALAFYEGLEEDNSREYWQAHRGAWEREVHRPLLALAEDLTAEFGRPKLFRPHRDLRFTPDKRPYTEHAGLVAAPDPGAGALYAELSPGGLLVAGGWYDPSTAQLTGFRRAVDVGRTAAAFTRLVDRLTTAGYALDEGAPLATAPRGWPRDHPRIGLLRLRRITVGRRLAPGPWLHRAEAVDRLADGWREVRTLGRWLAAHAAP